MDNEDKVAEQFFALRASNSRFKQLSPVLEIPATLYYFYAFWQHFNDSGLVVRFMLTLACWVALRLVVLMANRIISMALAFGNVYLSWAWSAFLLCAVPWALEALLLSKGLNWRDYSSFFWLVEIVSISISIWLLRFTYSSANIGHPE